MSSRVERYTPADDKWEVLKPLACPRFFAHLLPVTGHMLLVGGATIDEDGNLACVDIIERFEHIILYVVPLLYMIYMLS